MSVIIRYSSKLDAHKLPNVINITKLSAYSNHYSADSASKIGMQLSSIFIKGIVQSQKVKLNVQLVLILPQKTDLFAYNFHNQFIYSKITGKFHNALIMALFRS